MKSEASIPENIPRNLLEKVTAALAKALGEAVRTIAASAAVNRGVCAGSVSYTTKPTEKVGAREIFTLVREAYAANGLEIDLATEEGADMFTRIFLEAIKAIVSESHRVGGFTLSTAQKLYYTKSQ